MLNTKPKSAEQITVYDVILSELRDLKEGMREVRKELKETRAELNGRMDKIETRMDKFDEKIDTTRQELNGRMDKLENEIRSSTRHSQILTVSVVGIALAVIYAVLR